MSEITLASEEKLLCEGERFINESRVTEQGTMCWPQSCLSSLLWAAHCLRQQDSPTARKQDKMTRQR